ncbi:MAG: hypothetical protein K1X79_05585 [Oligoflexia bacterium]|nr:hypothetical protein [Oligoflexia bacterium]
MKLPSAHVSKAYSGVEFSKSAETSSGLKYNAAQAGFLLLDFVLSLALTLPILALLSLAAIRARSITSSIQDYSSFELQQRHLEALMQQLASTHQSQPFFPARLYSAGSLKFAGGGPIRLSGVNAPLPSSHAIGAIETNIEASFLVQSIGGTRLQGCPRYPSPVALSTYRTFLGISANGIHEFAAQSGASGNCRKFQLVPVESLFSTRTSSAEVSFIRVLIPVKRTYVLYVNKHRELRYLGLRGNTVIENQPILGALSDFRLSFEPVPAPNLKAIKLEAVYKGRTLGFTTPFLLATNVLDNFSMNRP